MINYITRKLPFTKGSSPRGQPQGTPCPLGLYINCNPINGNNQSFVSSLFHFLLSTDTIKIYLGVVTDMVISLMLDDLVVVDASSFPTRTLKYAGCFGSARILVLLLSIATTSNMVGRSTAFSCTHSNPMFMHLINSSEWCMGTNEASTSSLHLPSSYNCHACFAILLLNN